MNISRALSALAGTLVLASGCSTSEPLSSTPSAALGLAGTSWRLVQFEGGDGQVLRPDDRSKYTVEFNADGTLSARLDCNRGRGTWKASGSQLEFGPMALTRMMCPQPALHDQMAKQWTFVRSYLIRDGHLFLSLMADGGTYEFEPIATETS